MATPLLLRRLLLLCAATGLGAGPAFAQSEPVRFGQIDLADLTAVPFVGDSAAAVVVLCDYGSTSIPNGELRFDRVTRIKILKPAGLEWANVSVLLRHDSPGAHERLTNLQGFTYNLLNGKAQQTALAPAANGLLKQTEQYSLQKFALPNVRVGSVIEFRYTIYSSYLSTFRGWEFQRDVPVRWSEYRASIPHQFNYKMLLQTKQPLAVDEPANPKALLANHRWAMRDVPALRAEPFMTTTADYVDKLSFELANYGSQGISRSWEKIDQYLLHEWELGQQFDHFNFLKADLAQLPAPTPDNAPQRLAAVRALVLKAVRCTGELSMYSATPLRKIYQEKHQGTTAEINFLLIAALRGAGFAANPVLLSTRAHGRVRATMPEMSQFNYIAAHVALADGQELVLDATDPLQPYDMLPDGYALAETPKSKALDLPDNGGRFACSTTANGTAVQLTSRLLLRKPVYTAAEYAGLRELFRQMLEKQAERLVIKKLG